MVLMCFLDNRNRCGWCNSKNELYIKYHDEEWGIENFDENYLFEMLLLESFQAGLSWECILNKREAFKEAFDSFDYHKISQYNTKKVESLMKNEKIIRNERKIKASINNAKVFLEIEKKYGSFASYLKTIIPKETIYENDKTTSILSDELSFSLKKKGMQFVGSTIIYSYLQSIGVIHSHEKDCFLYQGRKEEK